ncbi:MAG: porin [Desulfobacterales bacterium]|nr:porin [Desulfobacterales bacterium]
MKKIFVILVTAIMISTAGSVAASDVSLYSSIRMGTWWESYSEEQVGGTEPDSDLNWDLQSNSRFGATFKGDTFSGVVEIGLKGPGDANDVYTRKIYGTYNFGGIELLVGQTYTPVDDAYSGQVWDADLALEGFGDLQPGRKPMIQLTFDALKVAFISPDADGAADTTVDVTIPTLEASYTFDLNHFAIDLYGGYATYEEKGMDVDSYILAVGARADLDPVYLKTKVSLGQNLGNYGGIDSASRNGLDEFDAANGEDADSFGIVGIVGFLVNDKTNFEAGIGYSEDERDALDDDAIAYYLQAKINITKGFRIIPEVGYLDYGEDETGAEEGDVTYFGAQWRIDL